MEEIEDCGSLLTTDILRNCDENNVGGIEVNLLLFNRADIDFSATTFSPTSPTTITNFALKAGKQGYYMQGVKQVNALRFELVKKDLSEDVYKHTFAGVLPNASAVHLDTLEEFKKGELVVMVETKFKGVLNKDAFKVGGFFAGLKLMVATYSTAENDATVSFELASADTFEEPKPILTVLETDYPTTKTAFDNRFEVTP